MALFALGGHHPLAEAFGPACWCPARRRGKYAPISRDLLREFRQKAEAKGWKMSTIVEEKISEAEL